MPSWKAKGGKCYWSPPDTHAADADADKSGEVDETDPNKTRSYEVQDGTVKWLMTSQDFGQSWNYTKMPALLQANSLSVDPTNGNSLFAVTANCLAHSTNQGLSWSPCSTASGLNSGRGFSKLIIKTSQVMFMLRQGDVPLRTKDGGATWQALTGAAALFKYTPTLDCSMSWSGETIVLHGNDPSAIERGEYGTVVAKSSDDGDSWTDETGDLVTTSPGVGVWFEKDFYLASAGEGVTVKRNLEA